MKSRAFPSRVTRRLFLFAFAAALLLRPTRAEAISDEALKTVLFEQKLGGQLTQNLSFRDENAQEVQLADYLGTQPLVLVLGYHQCPMLCNLVLNGLVDALQEVRWSAGKEFTLVNVSIDPRETPALARAKKQMYLKRYGRSGAERGWHFLTGSETAIRSLAQEIGFHYALDPVTGQYAHASGFVLITPQGVVARYFLGIAFSARELSTALKDAAANQVAQPLPPLLLLCFHYNPVTGKYSLRILALVRLLGAATVLLLVGAIFTMNRSRHPGVVEGMRNSARPVTMPKGPSP